MRDAPLGPLWLVARSEIRRRAAGLVVLGVLAGVAAGLAIASVDGARRSETAYERMRTEFLAADAVFFPSQVGLFDHDASLVGKLDGIPEVTGWGGFALNDGRIDGFAPDVAPMITVGAGWFDTVERATVLQGRLPDPSRDDEAVLTESALPNDLGIGLGSVLTWRHLSRAQSEMFQGEPPEDFDFGTEAEGPVTQLRVVGVVRLPMDSVVSFAAGGLLLASPGWAAAHLDETWVYFTNAIIRLRNGAADVPALRDAIGERFGRTDLPVKDLSQDVKRIEGSLDLERNSLLLFALAVVLAGIVIVGQTLSRSARAGAESAPVLSSMGLPRSALVIASMIPLALSAVVALAVAVVSTIVLSARFPIGLSRQLDPSLGVHVDATLLAIGLFATVAFMAVGGYVASMLAIRAQTGTRRLPRTRTVSAAGRGGLPVPTAVGLSLALEEGRGNGRGAAVRPALVAATVGVLGVVGATTIVAGIDDAFANKERTGAVWDVVAYSDGPDAEAETDTSLRADGDVVRYALMERFAGQVDGFDTPLYSLELRKGGLDFVTLTGRAPAIAGEAAIGPRTADHLDVDIGDTLSVGSGSLALRITGTVLLPQTAHSAFDEGLWVTPADLVTMLGQAGDPERDRAALIDLLPGTDVEEYIAGLPTYYAETASQPVDVVNLTKVRRLPYALAGFLVVLAVGAVAHTLLSGSRRRAYELAVLRSMGLTPGQTAACVAWQATVIGTLALVIGLPAGVLAGRQAWRLIADSLSFVYRAPFAQTAVLVAVPVVLLTLAVLTLWPARTAGRLHTAEVLRRE